MDTSNPEMYSFSDMKKCIFIARNNWIQCEKRQYVKMNIKMNIIYNI